MPRKRKPNGRDLAQGPDWSLWDGDPGDPVFLTVDKATVEVDVVHMKRSTANVKLPPDLAAILRRALNV
jgi:hypothetical protein